ncbi:MAG: tetratricopeptide repeat protein [Bacteroidota bacterium]
MAGLKFNLLTIVILVIIFSFANLSGQETKENAEFKLAVNLYNDGMNDLALEQFKNFVNTYPGSNQAIEARFYIGLVQMRLKNFEDARFAFQNFALNYTDNAKSAEAWYKVGECYVALKNYREAALAFERIKVFHLRHQLVPDALLRSADYFRQTGDITNARKNLRAILQDYGNSDAVHGARFKLAEMNFEEGNIDLATNEVSRVIDTKSKYAPYALILMGKIQQSLGQIADAEKKFLEIINTYKVSPAVATAHFELGKLYKQTGENSKAIEQFKKAIGHKEAELPTIEEASLMLGIVLFENKDYTNATKQFENFIATYSASENLPKAMLWAGKTAVITKNYKTALGWYDKIIESKLADEYKQTAFVRASFASETSGNIEQAIDYCNLLIQNFPQSPGKIDAFIRIGDLYKNIIKDYKKAIINYENALSASKQSSYISAVKLSIAECYRSLGDFERAKIEYENLIKNYPSDIEGIEAKNNLELINIFDTKDYKNGLEKLARLIGSLISEKPKADIAFELAQLYFGDLKDYISAIDKYTIAIEGGVKEDNLITAQFNRAKAAEYLSVNDKNFLGDAVNYYSLFIQNFPGDKKAEDAAYDILKLKIEGNTEENVEKLVNDFISRYSKSLNSSKALALLAGYYLNKQKYTEAVSIYKKILKEPADSETAEYSMLQLGKLYQTSGVVDSVISTWRIQSEKFPKSTYTARCLKLLGTALAISGKPVEASKVFEKLLDEFYHTSISSDSRKDYIDALIASGNYEQAIVYTSAMINSEIQNPFIEQFDIDYKLMLAKAYDRQGETQKALVAYHEYLRNSTASENRSNVYVALGNIARGRGDVIAASAYYKLAGQSGSAAVQKDVADLLFQTGKYAEADKLYGELVKAATLEEEKKFLQARLIISKLRSDNLNEAQPLISEFSKNYKKSTDQLAEFEYEKALIYYRKQDYPTAKKIFEDLASDYSSTRFGQLADYYLGKIMELHKKILDAVKKFESILKRNPNPEAAARVLLALGNISYNAEKLEDAIRYYQRILELPDKGGDMQSYAMTNLIESYEATKLYDASLKMARDFIERFPKDQSIIDKKIKIGVHYIRLGYYDQAIIHFRALLDELSTEYEAELRYNLGESYYYQGDYQQAILEFLKVPYLVTNNEKTDWTATSFYMAGQSYERMGKYDQAISMYQQIIDRPGIDVNFKAGARKEIDRVKSVIGKDPR